MKSKTFIVLLLGVLVLGGLYYFFSDAEQLQGYFRSADTLSGEGIQQIRIGEQSMLITDGVPYPLLCAAAETEGTDDIEITFERTALRGAQARSFMLSLGWAEYCPNIDLN